MQYFGGKAKVGKHIADYINTNRQAGQSYWEPFVGGAWIMYRVLPVGPRIGSDVCAPLIALYQKLQEGWQPPQAVTEEDYARAKAGLVEPYMQAFIGFGCSFAGKWFGGFARQAGYNFARGSGSSLLKKAAFMGDVVFRHQNYLDAPPIKNAVIYCDPPYTGTTGYSAAPKYRPEEFWNACRAWAAQGNTVLVSEYAAPPDFELVLEIATHTQIRNGANVREKRTEKLFLLDDLRMRANGGVAYEVEVA